MNQHIVQLKRERFHPLVRFCGPQHARYCQYARPIWASFRNFNRNSNGFVGLEDGIPTLEELCELVRTERGSTFIHNGNFRWVNLNQVCPEPRVRITREHVENVLGKRRLKQISERQLIDLATMILINGAYYWECQDEDAVGEWVERLSLDLIPEG
jgi:hypothetical protein